MCAYLHLFLMCNKPLKPLKEQTVNKVSTVSLIYTTTSMLQNHSDVY